MVIALLVGGGALAVQQGWSSADTAPSADSPPADTTMPSAGHSMSMPSETESAPAPSPSPDPSPSSIRSARSSRAGEAGAAQLLAYCQDQVRAVDRVLKAADVGIGHWAEHVQAQTDANAGRISARKMDAIFTRTRLDGPDDVAAYDQALDDLDPGSDRCDEPKGLTGPVGNKIKDCADRDRAQLPVLAAARDGMDDWESHLAAMRRSRMGHVDDAQGVWVRAWRAAPKHISTHEAAVKEFDAPRC